MKTLKFTGKSWDDYSWWIAHDRKALKKISDLIKDIDRNGNEGIGHPEPLSGNYAEYWSRHITDKHRLIYKVSDTEIEVLKMREHYDDR
jgi:toxin YoeB